MKDFARDRVLHIANSGRTAMKVRRRFPPSSVVDAPRRLVRRRKLLAPRLKLDRSRLALRLLLNQVGKAKRKRWKNHGGQRQLLRSLYPDTRPHTNAIH